MINTSINKILCVLVFLGGLAGCGFHLAGTGKLPDDLDAVSVQGVSSSPELSHLITQSLESRQINVVEKDQAKILVNVLREHTSKTVLAFDNEGKVREYGLTLSVTFDVRKPDNSYLLGEQSISVTRNLIFDKDNVLGTREEEQQLLDEMRRDAARRILYRLQKIKD